MFFLKSRKAAQAETAASLIQSAAEAHAKAVEAVRMARARKDTRKEGEALTGAHQKLHHRMKVEQAFGAWR
jgi:hypothetical protein